jgi:hypothetical protein
MSGKNIKWRRAKTASKPSQYANVNFPPDGLGMRAKRAFEEWRQTLTPRQRRSLCRPPMR